MYLLVHRANHWFSLPAISVIGALFQFRTALGCSNYSPSLSIFLPPLILASAGLTGLAVGFATLALLKHWRVLV